MLAGASRAPVQLFELGQIVGWGVAPVRRAAGLPVAAALESLAEATRAFGAAALAGLEPARAESLELLPRVADLAKRLGDGDVLADCLELAGRLGVDRA